MGMPQRRASIHTVNVSAMQEGWEIPPAPEDA
jgi:hypothetical protein